MIVGHKKSLDLLNNIFSSESFSHYYLFIGPENVGKTTTAKYLAKKLLCEAKGSEACGNCSSCKLFDAGNQPDFFINDKPSPLLVEEIRELIHFLELKPYQSGLKIAIISHAERLTDSAANSFLKTLEEPAAKTLIFLTAENAQNLLPTIVSRAQGVRFNFNSNEEIKTYLKTQLELGDGEINKIINYSDGRIGLANELAKNKNKIFEIEDFIRGFLKATKSESLVEKMTLAGLLSEKKEEIPIKLNYLESYLNRKLVNSEQKESLKIAKVLYKIARSREYLSKNVNSRLVIESLLLERN